MRPPHPLDGHIRAREPGPGERDGPSASASRARRAPWHSTPPARPPRRVPGRAGGSKHVVGRRRVAQLGRTVRTAPTPVCRPGLALRCGTLRRSCAGPSEWTSLAELTVAQLGRTLTHGVRVGSQPSGLEGGSQHRHGARTGRVDGIPAPAQARGSHHGCGANHCKNCILYTGDRATVVPAM